MISAFPGHGRIPKSYISLYDDADPRVEGATACWRFRDARTEAEAIASSCKALIAEGMLPREIMVLLSNVRALGRSIVEAFEDAEVPFEPPREARFKDGITGRALLTLLRLAGTHSDLVALRTLVELRRGVGISTADGIARVALENAFTYRELFYDPLAEEAFSGRQLAALRPCRDIAQELAEWAPADLLSDRREQITGLLERILNKEPENDWEDEALGLPDIATLDDLGRYVGAEKDQEQAEVLAAIGRRAGAEVAAEEFLAPRVRMMTMHGAKGLSAQIVFIPGLEEEILPGDNRRPYPGQVLEAARMLFVSITRARLGCLVTYADRRIVNGQFQAQTASRFAPHLGKAFTRRAVGLTDAAARRVVEESAKL